jgi:hypothetical protein
MFILQVLLFHPGDLTLFELLLVLFFMFVLPLVLFALLLYVVVRVFKRDKGTSELKLSRSDSEKH